MTAPPPPQPNVHAPAMRRAKKAARVLLKFLAMLCGRGRMPCAKQAKGQRNEAGIGGQGSGARQKSPSH